MGKINNKTIIVLGMHRSGTSMTAKILSVLGVDMGKSLFGPSPFNVKGYFENAIFEKLNVDILKSANGNWCNPPNYKAILNQKEKFQKKIQKICNKKGLWGWKDPRTSLTIELYISYLKNPHFIFCKRNNKDVARSLRRRNHININKGMILARIYKKRVVDFLKKYPNSKRFDFYYEKVIADPQREIRKLIDFLDLNPTNSQYQKAISSVLDNKKIRSYSRRMAFKNFKIEFQNKIKKPWRLRHLIKRIFYYFLS